MAGLPWFRLYRDMIDDPKIGTLKDSEFRLFIEILCVACEANMGGSTDKTSSELGWRLRRTIDRPLNELLKRGLIFLNCAENNDKIIFVSAWEKRQFPSDSSKERVRKHREMKQECNVSVTLQKRSCNALDTDTDTDTDTQKDMNTSYSCSEAKNLASEPSSISQNIFISIPLVGDEEFPVTDEMIEEFKKCYPRVDIEQEMRTIRGWNFSNPIKRKTKRGILRHINSWLSDEQNKAGKNNQQSFSPRVLNNVQHNQLLLEQIHQEEDQKRLRGEFDSLELIEKETHNDFYR